MNEYQKYKENSIYSMSGQELLLLLYDEAIKRLKKADYALEDKEYAIFNDSIARTSKIIQYLISILDMQQPVSQDLRRIYNYLVYDLSRIKSGRERQKEEIGRVSNILSELRDAFEEAGRQAGDTHKPQIRSVWG